MFRRILLLSIAVFFSGHATASDGTNGKLHVSGAWARPLPSVATVGAAYLTLHNAGEHAVRVVGGSSPMANRVEVHTHEEHDGMMRMRKLDALEVPPGDTVTLEPGGLHIMLMGLRGTLEAGNSFALELEFEGGDSVATKVAIGDAPPGKDGDGKHGGGHGSGHDEHGSHGKKSHSH